MDILTILAKGVKNATKSIWGINIDSENVQLNTTRKEFEGDYTVVVFALLRFVKGNPQEIAEKLGEYLVENMDYIVDFNIVKGFLNLSVSDDYWIDFLEYINSRDVFGQYEANGKKWMIEFSSPNTNKPLHLGHIRNILLGWSMSKIYEAYGYDVIRTQIVNDRGIAVCKSILAWEKDGMKSPEDLKMKGDHFVGKYYVNFERLFQSEYSQWQTTKDASFVYENRENKDLDEVTFFSKYKNDYFNEYSIIGKEAREMLIKWENGDDEVISKWRKLNDWVYEGFDVTYEKLGISFTKNYYESDTYILGRSIVEKGLESGVFYKEKDNSIWIDLEDVGMDKKIVLRSDGTAVYITQDIGTAEERYKDFKVDEMSYVVADEQNYHFKVLFEILKRLKVPYSDGLHHLSYGMVDLPSGRMKSREGTVVDADDLIDIVIGEAKKITAERGDLANLNAEERHEIERRIGMAALKYFIIKVNPKRRMTFNPEESVDMQGNTGPHIQYSYVRINGVLRKASIEKIDYSGRIKTVDVQPSEKELLILLQSFPSVIKDSAESYDPSTIANFAYFLAKAFHKFYHDCMILSADNENEKLFRLKLSDNVGRTLKYSMELLGIEMPDKM